MIRHSLLIVVLALVVGSCGGVDLSDVSVPEEISEGFDLDAVLEQARNCEELANRFVAVVAEAAEDVDERAAEEDSPIPEAELREKVEAVAASRFYALAERLGCDRVETRARTIEQLRELAPDSEAGEEMVDEVIRRVEGS